MKIRIKLNCPAEVQMKDGQNLELKDLVVHKKTLLSLLTETFKNNGAQRRRIRAIYIHVILNPTSHRHQSYSFEQKSINRCGQ